MALKLSLDLDGCKGYACCMLESPNLFDIDDETGMAIQLVDSPTEELREEAECAVRACPAGIITLTEV